MKTQISEKIQMIRHYLHLSKNKFANRIEMSLSHITRLENGVTDVSDEIITKVCKTFSIDPYYFNAQVKKEDIKKYISENQIPDDFDGMTVGERLRSLRLNAGLTIQDLADGAGCDRNVISEVERGVRRLTYNKAVLLADYLHIGVDYLMEGRTSRRDWPVNKQLTDWLWEHEDVRKELWEKYNSDNK